MCAYNNYKYSFKSQFVSILCHVVSYFAGVTYALVYWVGEDSSSVVQGIHVGHGLNKVGEVSKIKFSGGIYDGLVVSSG